MSLSLALRAPATAPSDFIGAPTASLYMTDLQAGLPALDTDPGMGLHAAGAAMQGLSVADAASVLEALADQTTALSLVLAADAAGAITLPDSLRAIVRAAAALPPFLSGAH